jgi:hypothetical protein
VGKLKSRPAAESKLQGSCGNVVRRREGCKIVVCRAVTPA